MGKTAINEAQYSVSFPVYLMWEPKSGPVRRIMGRCLFLSQEEMRVETKDRLEKGTLTMVASDDFGRMGHATVRYCERDKMLYTVGLTFGFAFGLSDPARQRILERVLRPDELAASPPASVSRRARSRAAR